MPINTDIPSPFSRPLMHTPKEPEEITNITRPSTPTQSPGVVQSCETKQPTPFPISPQPNITVKPITIAPIQDHQPTLITPFQDLPIPNLATFQDHFCQQSQVLTNYLHTMWQWMVLHMQHHKKTHRHPINLHHPWPMNLTYPVLLLHPHHKAPVAQIQILTIAPVTSQHC